jgi:hypothetical protein
MGWSGQALGRFGYRRIHDLRRPELPGVNHKRIYRLYSVANLAVRRRKKAKRPVNERVPLQLAQGVNEVWSMDFVSDSLANGRHIKCLTVADDFSHECVDITVVGHLGPVRHQVAGPRCHLPGLSIGCSNRQRSGVHQPSIHGLGAKPWHPALPDRAGPPDAERLS